MDQEITSHKSTCKLKGHLIKGGCINVTFFTHCKNLEFCMYVRTCALYTPTIIIFMFNRTYMALETLTEPHQLVAVLQCVAAVSRVLLSGGWERYVPIRTCEFK